MRLIAITCMLAVGPSLAVVAQAEAPWSLIGEGVAITVLAWAVYFLLSKHLPAQSKAFTTTLDKMAERHDGWEKARHDDSVALNETLQHLRENCATVNAGKRRP